MVESRTGKVGSPKAEQIPMHSSAPPPSWQPIAEFHLQCSHNMRHIDLRERAIALVLDNLPVARKLTIANESDAL